MRTLDKGIFTGERALFQGRDLKICDSIFEDGESPLKHSRDIELYGSMFRWKYPLWYSENVKVYNCTFFEPARAGIWYTNNIEMHDTMIEAPKEFRRCDGITLENVTFTNAAETLWECRNARLTNITAKGDYLAMNSSDIVIENLQLVGNYPFDGAKNITVRNSKLISKDAFWNAENITLENCFVSGEYLAWNSKNVTLINCTIESLQGLCYVENLIIRDCKFINTTLAFEYSTVDAKICGCIESIKNPAGGTICADCIGELILEEDKVDISRIRICERAVC
ncbi:MAG: DUF3737 family protein [Ruminiclostridium sp.]|nr:DUF3737 family protein [Ruminiclostridium sp.]